MSDLFAAKSNKPERSVRSSIFLQEKDLETSKNKSEFWIQTKSWKSRKEEAVKVIKIRESLDYDDLHFLAYHGYNDIISEKIRSENEKISIKLKEKQDNDKGLSKRSLKVEPTDNDSLQTRRLRTKRFQTVLHAMEAVNVGEFFRKDQFELTPLIYAIWGEEDRMENESDKKTSMMIIEHIDFIYENKLIALPKTSHVKNELGHALIHGILEKFSTYPGGNSNFDNWIEKFVSNDFEHSLSYIIEKKGFTICNRTFTHEVCMADENISLIAFSLRVRSIQCSKLLFEQITNNFLKLSYEELQIIEDEISEYLNFDSTIAKKLLDSLVYSQEKSLWVNIQKVPQFKTVKGNNFLISEQNKKNQLKAKQDSYNEKNDEEDKEVDQDLKVKEQNIEEIIKNQEELKARAEIKAKKDQLKVKEEQQRVIKLAYSSFDGMFDANEFIKSTIISSKIKLPTSIGTQKSLDFIQNLASTTDLKLFNVDLIKYYLQYKWDTMWPLIFIQSILMWANIPMITYLVLVNRFDRSVLVPFTFINIFLMIFEFLQLFSMNIFHYLGNVDRVQSCLTMRLLSLCFMFLSDFQPFNCIIYLLISAFFIPGTERNRKLLKVLGYLGVYILLIFPGFWNNWDSVGYLMLTFGLVACLFLCFVLCKIRWAGCSWRHIFRLYAFNSFQIFQGNRVWFFINWGLKTILLGLLIVIIFLTEENYGIMVLTELITVLVLVSQFYKCNKRFYFFRLLLNLFILIIFSINFTLNDRAGYFIVNLLVLIVTVINISLDYKRFIKKLNHEEGILVAFILSYSTVLGLNIENSIPLKSFVLFAEICLLFAFKITKKIKISVLLKGALALIINWNSLDIVQIIICIVWLNDQYSNEINLDLTYAYVILILLRGLTGFRCFKLTRYYVRLIFHASQEIFPFLLIFFYTTVSFGAICLVFKDISVSEIWVYPYDLSIGSPSHDSSFDINYISFVVATVVNVIVILNLLISILGDSFDQFQVNAAEFDYLEMAETLAEFETMAFFRRITARQWPGEYLVGILAEANETKRKGKVTRDEFFELKKTILYLKESMNKNFKLFEEEIDKSWKENDGKKNSVIIQRGFNTSIVSDLDR